MWLPDYADSPSGTRLKPGSTADSTRAIKPERRPCGNVFLLRLRSQAGEFASETHSSVFFGRSMCAGSAVAQLHRLVATLRLEVSDECEITREHERRKNRHLAERAELAGGR